MVEGDHRWPSVGNSRSSVAFESVVEFIAPCGGQIGEFEAVFTVVRDMEVEHAVGREGMVAWHIAMCCIVVESQHRPESRADSRGGHLDDDPLALLGKKTESIDIARFFDDSIDNAIQSDGLSRHEGAVRRFVYLNTIAGLKGAHITHTLLTANPKIVAPRHCLLGDR